MKPLDPRLLRSTRAVRVHLAVTVACGLGLTGLILAQAALLAGVIAGASGGLVALGAVVITRALLSYGAEAAALRSAASVKSALRRRLVAHVTGPAADPVRTDAGELATLATRGLDGLDDYVARYLPQLVLAALVPVAVLVVVVRADWVSALVIGLTLPLIPVFMALVGWQAQDHTRRQWRLLERLGGHFLDAVEGLPTLAVFRRARAEAALIRRTTDEHREATMGTLRIAFLSAFVLELVATVAVALVAVEVGLRLLYGQLDLETALLVLILAPEAYLPLREVGARFHASTEGVAAAERVFAVLDGPGGAAPAGHAPVPERPEIRFHEVSLTHPGRSEPALDRVDLVLAPGTATLLTGPSGAGKTSLLGLLLRFADPTAGTITVDGRPLADVPADAWRRRIAYLPQRPYLFDASVADNIRLGAPDAPDAEVEAAARLAAAHGFVTALPDGYATRLGERGTRLSAGQRQRIGLARAFLRARDATLLLLDEPTAHLDEATATQVRAGIAHLARGRTAVIVAHDEGWAALADETLDLNPGHPPTATRPRDAVLARPGSR